MDDNTCPNPQSAEASPAFHPLAIGNPAMLTRLTNKLPQYFPSSMELISADRVLCIPDSQHDQAVQIFASKSDILKPCEPLPLQRQDSQNHKYPRFKVIDRTDFWLLVPASYCHISCEVDNIEWSLGHLPYPKLHIYIQSLIDTKMEGDLSDLIDGMDLTYEWGLKNLNLGGVTDTEWLKWLMQGMRDDGFKEMFIFVDPKPVSQLEIWKKYVTTKQTRMGWKYSPEIYATRFRRFGSKDPRIRSRPGI
ncbi:hypothetical protein EMCG_03934 [[Emmonsia] crescens]|uniref:Uncharacterized protein n=1 Tax=[Emmonsia] crescens TaxID=73230 RepID=A0A0G2HTJ4_9EURO|nr:hypothetical protein EMCG_03934 [Emmonsia crescens UAMH 3008]